MFSFIVSFDRITAVIINFRLLMEAAPHAIIIGVIAKHLFEALLSWLSQKLAFCLFIVYPRSL